MHVAEAEGQHQVAGSGEIIVLQRRAAVGPGVVHHPFRHRHHRAVLADALACCCPTGTPKGPEGPGTALRVQGRGLAGGVRLALD